MVNAATQSIEPTSFRRQSRCHPGGLTVIGKVALGQPVWCNFTRRPLPGNHASLPSDNLSAQVLQAAKRGVLIPAG